MTTKGTKGLITELPPKERAAMRKRMKMIAHGLRMCEARIQCYLAGEDNIWKTTADLKYLRETAIKIVLDEIDDPGR